MKFGSITTTSMFFFFAASSLSAPAAELEARQEAHEGAGGKRDEGGLAQGGLGVNLVR